MKNVLLIFSAAAMVLAACSKNEVVPATVAENVEISYNVAPRTKADAETYDAFSTSNVFASWAYYLPEGKTWANERLTAQTYIDGVTISHQEASNVWKNSAETYYWPKTGKLTFFAYSLNKGDLNLKNENGATSIVQCYNADSVYGINAWIDLQENPNTDFLVAQIAEDKSGNTEVYNFNGVPTLFRHRLSRVAFAVRKSEDYANKEIILDSIVFKNMSHFCSYSQYHKNSDGTYSEYLLESGARISQAYTKTAKTVSSTDSFESVGNEVNYIYIPQVFKGKTDNDVASFVVTYTVKTKVGDNTIEENCSKTINLMDLFNSWEMGKRYTINLTFGLDEILWAPAVEDWTDGKSAGIDINA